MPTVLLILSLVGAVFVLNALVAVRVQPLSVASFFAGWLTGELALQHIVWSAGLTVGLGVAGAWAGWQGWLGVGIAVLDWLGLAFLAAAGFRAGPTVKRALERASGGPLASLPDPPEPQWFDWWRVALAMPIRGPEIERIKDIDYWGDGIRRHRLDVLRSRKRPPHDAPVLVQIHGGAWMMGDKREQGIPFMHELVNRGWVCAAINYRLSPKGTWPDHVVDCKRAVAWVKEHIAEYGGDPNFVVVTGGSAGGHLSSLTALTANDPAFQPGFEDADTTVQACVPFYGVYDMTGTVGVSRLYGRGFLRMLERMVMKKERTSDPELFDRASPIQRVHADAPPFLVFHGTNDTLVPVETTRRFVAELRAISRCPVAYAELAFAQHAFDILVSPRCWAACAGAVAFVEEMRRQDLDRRGLERRGTGEATEIVRQGSERAAG